MHLYFVKGVRILKLYWFLFLVCNKIYFLISFDFTSWLFLFHLCIECLFLGIVGPSCLTHALETNYHHICLPGLALNMCLFNVTISLPPPQIKKKKNNDTCTCLLTGPKCLILDCVWDFPVSSQGFRRVHTYKIYAYI